MIPLWARELLGLNSSRACLVDKEDQAMRFKGEGDFFVLLFCFDSHVYLLCPGMVYVYQHKNTHLKRHFFYNCLLDIGVPEAQRHFSKIRKLEQPLPGSFHDSEPFIHDCRPQQSTQGDQEHKVRWDTGPGQKSNQSWQPSMRNDPIRTTPTMKLNYPSV